MSARIKKGSDVKVITGQYKGSTGKVKSVDKSKNKAIVTGVNTAKKHQKPTATSASGIISKELPIHISNLALADNS